MDRTSGQVLWKRPLSGGNNRQRKQNMSSPSPVTDGTTVWVHDRHRVLKAFDFAGKELWSRDIQKDYGRVRPQLGLRLVAAAARGRAVRAGAARDEDRRSVVPAADRQGHRQDGVEGRAADRRHSRIARRLHDAGAGAVRQRDRDRDHRRRCRHRPRSGDGQGAVARERAQPDQRSAATGSSPRRSWPATGVVIAPDARSGRCSRSSPAGAAT